MFKHIGTQLMLAGVRLSAGPTLEMLRRQLDAAKASFETRTAEPRVTTWHRAHGNRECERRRRQKAHERQLASHINTVRWQPGKPQTAIVFQAVKPRHIFGSEP